MRHIACRSSNSALVTSISFGIFSLQLTVRVTHGPCASHDAIRRPRDAWPDRFSRRASTSWPGHEACLTQSRPARPNATFSLLGRGLRTPILPHPGLPGTHGFFTIFRRGQIGPEIVLRGGWTPGACRHHAQAPRRKAWTPGASLPTTVDLVTDQTCPGRSCLGVNPFYFNDLAYGIEEGRDRIYGWRESRNSRATDGMSRPSPSTA